MRLSFLRSQNLPALVAAAFMAAVIATPASAEPSTHATSPALDLAAPSTLAGPQDDAEDDALALQPQPVYPDGEPGIETITSDDPDEVVAPTAPVVVATIDKSQQLMTVFVDGVETYAWPVSTGKPGYATPSGDYTASSMNKIWYSKQWDNAPMPHAVFFTKQGHAIHATNEVRNLGKPASHGCVRLSPKNAETFFNLVKETGLENTEVVLTGSTPGGDYKVAHPQQRDRYQGRDPYFDRYGYNEEQQPVQRKRRRLFQPYYQAPPRQYQQAPQQQQPQQRRRWFFRN
ncbi:MAG TPA: L,D-transpeptidase [Methyloceanibacter sp.]|nr:L,D-transpeptidase [Methyloceanibacter sp.]